jgi:tetratricopeptide (TPR) repeat protein
MTAARFWLLVCVVPTFVALPAAAATPRAATPEDATAAEARTAFQEGTKLVEQAQWAEALAAFERAAKLRPHAVTTYNMGACERAMGRYTRARGLFRQALEEQAASGGRQLPQSLAAETQGYLDQIEQLLVTVDVAIRPDNAAIQIDGRPLEAAAGQAPSPTLVAGLRAPGPGEPAPAGAFKLLIDPGPHVFSFARKGFTDQVVNKKFDPGKAYDLHLELDRLPATLHIASDRDGALVVVNGADVGPVPVDVLRPAGDYKVSVKKQGFAPYETLVSLKAGEETDLRAALPLEKRSILTRWWFWTATAAVVTGAAVGTYFLTRPAPVRPAPSGGSLGWTVQVP